MRRYLVIALSLVAPLFAAGSAGAVVVDMNPSAHGQPSVAYPTDQSDYYGVALVPGAREGTSTTAGYLAGAGIPAVSSSAPCADPAAGGEPDILAAGSWPLSEVISPLCWHSGAVMHSNETFTLEWEGSAPNDYWSGTQNFVQQFLKDVAGANNSLSSPYADTTQYWDGGSAQDRAANSSAFGGGCDDNGTAQCKFGSTTGSGPGNPLPSASDCPVSGNDYYSQGPGGGWVTSPNNLCLTDADIRHEITSMINNDGLIAHAQPGYTPLVVVLTPPGVEVCVDSAGTLCSANSDSTVAKAQFCSYHAVDPDKGVAYVVQPWSAFTSCDEPDVPAIPKNPTPDQVSQGAGARLVSPLSQAAMGSIVNPAFGGWFGLDGSEINDQNSCQPLPNGLDQFTIGSGSYYIQREFNNASVISSDPNTYSGCLPVDVLTPAFVVPSAVNPGDVVDFDGGSTRTSLLIPNADYRWNFGDGSTATGPSVAHSYATGGTYTVTLTVTDRGGNSSTLNQTITVLGGSGQVVTPPNSSGKHGLHVRILLMPQSLHTVLTHGVNVRVTSDVRASGIAWVSIPSGLAKRAHIKAGRKPFVVIGVGTVSGISDGTVSLHLKLSRSVAAKLRHLTHVTLSVRLSLVGADGNHAAVDAAGRY